MALDGVFNMLGSLGSSIIGAISNKQNTERTNKTNLQIAREANAQNQANWQAEFNYQKYLNENQHQIESQDLKKAGINPIVGAGGALSSFGGNSNTATAPTMQATDYSSMFNSIANAFLQNKALATQEKIAEKNNETQKQIAKDNNDTQKEVAKTQTEASKYNTDTQKEIAEMNAKNQKEIANLNTKTQKEIANASNQLQKDLQKNMQEWQDSDDHALAQQKIQRMLYNVQRDHELLQYAQNSRVAIKTETGEVKNLTIEDALKYAEMCAKLYDNSKARRVFKNVLEGIKGFSDVTRGAR